MLALLVASHVEARDRRCRPNRLSRTMDCDAYAFFEAFPASGAGTTTACSTTAPTGAKGETATVTRATSAMCQRTAAGGMVSSGIASGDLTLLSSGVVRQELDRNGVLGVRVEGVAINKQLQSQAFENAAHSKEGDVAGRTPAPWANDGGAPDGTQTADAVHFGPTANGSQYSDIFQSFTAAATSDATMCSYYVQGARPADGGVAGSGTIDVCRFDGAAWVCSDCSYVAGSYTRCSTLDAVGATGTTRFCKVGNVSNQNGGVARAGADVFLWQVDGVAPGPLMTSAIPTAGATVQRNADVVSFPVTLAGSTFSAGISYDTPATLASGMTAFQVYVDANNSVTAALDASNKVVCTFRIGGSDSTVTTAGAVTASAVNRVACTYGTAGRSACLNGTCTTTAGALTIFTGAATFYGGTRSATGNEANGVLSRWCYDPSDPRCVL